MKTGTQKNVAAFGKLVGICNDLGARYNPSKSDISTTALAGLLAKATTSIQAVDNTRTNYVIAVNNRQACFELLDPLASRVIRALIASGASAENIHDAILLKRKITPRKRVVGKASETGVESPVQKSSGVSYLDYENKVAIFDRLIMLVQSCSEYAPNEPELKLPALTAFSVELRTYSQNVMFALISFDHAREQLSRVLFGKGGVHEIGTAVKAYIRSVCGLKNYPASELGKLKLAA